MQFTSLLSLLLLTAFAAALPSVSQREGCGPDGHIISERTLVNQRGKEIKITTTACSGFTNDTLSLSKRQAVTQCQGTGKSDCLGLTCQPTIPQPNVDDCDEITNTQDDDFPDGSTFLVPARTTVAITSGTCKYAYQNLDTVDYNVCHSTLGLLGVIAVTNCFVNLAPITTHTAGTCTSNHTPGNDWEIHVTHV